MNAHRQGGPVPPRGGPSTVVLVAATVIFVVAMGSFTAIALAIEDGARATSMLGVLGTLVTSAVGFFALFVRQENQSRVLEDTNSKITYLANGGGDAKFRAAVAAVLADHLIDPEVSEQLERDRAHTEAAHAALEGDQGAEAL